MSYVLGHWAAKGFKQSLLCIDYGHCAPPKLSWLFYEELDFAILQSVNMVKWLWRNFGLKTFVISPTIWWTILWTIILLDFTVRRVQWWWYTVIEIFGHSSNKIKSERRHCFLSHFGETIYYYCSDFYLFCDLYMILLLFSYVTNFTNFFLAFF